MFKQLLSCSSMSNVLTCLLLVSFGFTSLAIVTIAQPTQNESKFEPKVAGTTSLQKFEKFKHSRVKKNTDKFLVELTGARQKEITSQLFGKNGRLESGEKSVEGYSLEELYVLPSLNQDNHLSLFSAIDKTVTAAGSVVLSSLLSNPVSDSSVIKKRQQVLSFLLKNQQAFDCLNNLIKQVKSCQNALLNYWNEEAALDENVKSLLYATKDSRFAFLNESPIYHQVSKLSSFFRMGIGALLTPHAVVSTFVLPIASIVFLALGDINKSLVTGVGAVGGISFLCSEKAFFNYFRLIHRTVFNIHQRLRHISKLTQSFDELFYAVQDYPELSNCLSSADTMSDFVVDPQSLSLGLFKLKDFLNRSIFDKETFGIFSHAGNVIVAHNYMEEEKDSFIEPFKFIGELDAYLSIVKLIKEYQRKPSGFCFVDFVEQHNPMMNLEGAWSLLVGGLVSKPVDITLGGNDNPSNAIIGGPIRSGKSLLVKTIASCDILARSFGIAPAKSAVMTIFDKMCTHISLRENGKIGSLSYASERTRGIEIMNYIRKNPAKKILAIIDEPYNNMIDESAELVTYDFVSEIAKYPNVLCVAATKHKKLTGLAEETGKWSNYHLDVSEVAQNGFERTFNVVPGKCDWWFADAAKRSRYIKSLN